MVLESGLLQEREERYELTGPLPPLAIPTTLHDSLMARLDRLATVKGLAQLGATLGREFSYELLHAVSPWDEETLQRGLHQLVEAEFLYQQGLPPQATYLFKHALIQDAAYQSLLRSTRQQYHQRIAQVLEAQFPGSCETAARAAGAPLHGGGLHVPGHALLADSRAARGAALGAPGGGWPSHHRGGGAPDPAGHARTHATGPAAPCRPRRVAHGRERPRGPGGGTGVYPRPGVMSAGGGHAPALSGAPGARLVLPQLRAAADGAGAWRSSSCARRNASRTWRHGCWGITYWGRSCSVRGALGEAGRHFAQAIATYDPQEHRPLAHVYGIDLGVITRSLGALVLWLRGYPDRALAQSQEAWTLAQEVAHPLSQVLAQVWLARLHQFRQEAQAAHDWAAGSIALAAQQGFSALYVAWGTMPQGWALTRQGQWAGGMAKLREGSAAALATGSELWRPYFLALLAEALGRRASPRTGSACWPRRRRSWLARTSASTRPNSPGSRGCCSWPTRPRLRRKPRPDAPRP